MKSLRRTQQSDGNINDDFMKDLHALRARLRHAGLKPASQSDKPRVKSAQLPADWPGQPVTGPDGIYYLAEYRYGPEGRPGDQGLLDFLPYSPLPDFLEIPRETDLSKMVFMDTETTGLAGGTGTLAFNRHRRMHRWGIRGAAIFSSRSVGGRRNARGGAGGDGGRVGAGHLQRTRLRRSDPAGTNLAAPAAPRRPGANAPLGSPPARPSLVEATLESCALRSLETELLGVRRSTEDVPSSMIPYLYREYLRTGDPRLIAGVLYHNVQDVLSMALLAARVLNRYTRPIAEIEDPLEVLSLAFAHRALGRSEFAESAFRSAAQSGLDSVNRSRALEGLAGILKAKGDSAAAVEFWEAWVTSASDDPRPSIELAKYYEWKLDDPATAMEWTERAGSAAAVLPAGAGRRDVERALAHRLARLQRKMNRRAESKSASPTLSHRKQRVNPHPAKAG